MNRDDFIGASISTRIYEKNLLTKNDLERLNDYDSLDEVLNALRDSVYRDSIQSLDNPRDYEKILTNELKRVYKQIEDISKNSGILQYLREKYNFHNLKVIIKEIIQNKDYSNLYSNIANIDVAYIKVGLVNENKAPKLALFDNIEGYEPFDNNKNPNDIYLTYAKDALDRFKETNNPTDIDITLDKDYYEKLLIDANNLKLEGLIKYTKERIDLINLKTLLRIRSQGEDISALDNAIIDGGYIPKSDFKELFDMDINQIVVKYSNSNINKYLVGSLSSDKSLDQNLLDLEKAIDDHFMDYSRDAKQMTFGPEILMNYIISKETEIKNLRIILVSKLNSLPKEFTRERLRESYV